MRFTGRAVCNDTAPPNSAVRSSVARETARDGQPLPRVQVTSVGAPLEPETRGHFERRFGHEFSRVRVHTDSGAASSARSAGAMAYTVGHDITFGAGMYNPKSRSGRKLLAHELAHVVQQDNPSRPGARASQHETEATTASDQAIRGERATVALGAPVSMQRQELPGAMPHSDLTESASPMLAAAIGSVTLNGFVTGTADVSDINQTRLAKTAETILKLLTKYPASKIRVTGYTDAVGQESDNQALGQARADSVQAALQGLGIPAAAIQTESRGAYNLLVKTDRAESRNRRVQVFFDTSLLFRGAMSGGLTLSPGSAQPAQTLGSGPGLRGLPNICIQNPTLCYGTGRGAPGETSLPPAALKPIPDNTPFHRMDVPGANEAYTSHGRSPQEGGDLRQTWARLYWKYKKLGLSEELAAKAANSELSSTAGKEQSRDNPNAADHLDAQMKQAYPNATSVGPANVTLFKF